MSSIKFDLKDFPDLTPIGTEELLPGRLYAWYSINPPSRIKHFEVENREEAEKLIERLADAQLKDDSIWANCMGICALDEDGDVIDVEEEDE